MHIDQARQLYQDVFLTGRNLAPLTRVAYRRDLADLIRFLTEHEPHGMPVDVSRIERRHLEAYLAKLDQRGLAGSYRRRKVATLRSFFGFLVSQDLIPRSPADKLIPPERERHQPRVLSEAEYTRLREAVRGQIRDSAIIELLLQTGMRLSELARLKVTDVALPARSTKDDIGAVQIHGKGRKERTATLNYKAVRAIKAYLQIRPAIAGEEHLFLTKFHKPLGPRSIENIVAKYLNEAGIHEASVHALRHTFATHHAKKGTSLRVVQQMLGHASLTTTSIYVDLAREQMEQEIQRNAL